MMFNNKLTKDNLIHFDPEEWECTDPDEWQYCRKISATKFEYIQLKDKELIRDSLCYGKLGLAYLNERTKPSDWWQDEIDVTCYSPEEKEEYLAPYGGILDGCLHDESLVNQLTAECIFETDYVMSND